jgi:hypothetical protein
MAGVTLQQAVFKMTVPDDPDEAAVMTMVGNDQNPETSSREMSSFECTMTAGGGTDCTYTIAFGVSPISVRVQYFLPNSPSFYELVQQGMAKFGLDGKPEDLDNR